MKSINRQLGIYSTTKKNQLKKWLKIASWVVFIVLIFLVSRQILVSLRTNQAIISPKENQVDQIKQIGWEKGLDINQIEEKSDMIILLLDSRTEVRLDKKKSLADQLNALQLIVNQDKINGRKAIKIDFRFNNPVVSY
jgi:flagellar biosynthesis/type III secretory pathway M-ring protein FliF/YscJ